MDFFTLIIIAVVLSIIGGILWWVAVIWLGVKVFKAVSRQMDAELKQINQLIQQAAASQAAARQAPRTSQSAPGVPGVPPALAQQIALRMFNAQRELNQLDDLRRQAYETRVASMQSQVASLGIDVTSLRS
jgi:hypothetical protein